MKKAIYKPKVKPTKGENVLIKKQTTLLGFTPEEEIKYLIERGDWELLLTAPAFRQRPPESQVQLLREAMDQRISQLGQTLNYLINRGPQQRAGAMGVLKRMREIRLMRDELIQHFYEQGQRVITEKIEKDKIEF